MAAVKNLLDDSDRDSIWLEVENRSSKAVLIRKYQRVDLFSEQRVFDPEERGLVTHGHAWCDKFRVKVYSLNEEMKKHLLLKLSVDKLYRIVVSDDGCSVRTLHVKDVDKQLCAYQRMEEVWDNSNYYETLRIPQNATAKEIRVAYLKLAKIYHPDHNKNPNAALMFERITEAYHTLYDEEVRRRYDAHLRTDPGILSKSYWRHVFLYWNRHKAIQVGISTLLCITGSAILLTSILAAPSGAALPASIIGGAIGGGMFASGIGGISVAMSRDAALEDNRIYKRWLKYSFWYGIAGAVTGSVSAGVGGLLGAAVGGGMAAVVASGAVNGAVQGLCFGVGSGIASDRWIGLIKKLRVDAIALDLAISTFTGAATGMVFQSLLMTTAGAPSAVMGHAKFSAEQLAGNNGGSLLPQKHPKRIAKRSRTNSDPLPLTYPEEDIQREKELEQERENILHSASANPVIASPHYKEERDDVSEELIITEGEVLKVTTPPEEEIILLREDSSSSLEEESSSMEEKDKEEIDDSSNEDNNDIPFFIPPEIDEFLKCEENTVESINEAISLYEEIAHAMPANFFQFYNHTRATKVRMIVQYAIKESNTGNDADSLKIVNDIVQPQEMYFIPDEAQFIELQFECSALGLIWDPIFAYQGYHHTYGYAKPLTRRFFVCGYGDSVHIAQIRDEYEQLVID